MITFDSSPTVYWFVGYLLAGIVVLTSYYKSISTKVYLIAGLLLLVMMRLPVIVFNRELNVDESQMLSHAITLIQDPVYWRSVDGTTIGPLDNYLLVIPKLLGFQINYTSGRVMGLFCAAGAWLFLFFSIRNWFGSQVARRISVVSLIFLAFIQDVDFVHYSSEQFPVLLLAICLWLLSGLDLKDEPPKTRLYFLGFTAGAVPFAKLQAVPLVAVMVICAFWFCYRWLRTARTYRPTLALVLGGLTVPAFFLLFTLYFGVFIDLIDFYLLGNAIYAGGGGLTDIPSQFFSIIKLSPDFQAFVLVLVIPMLLGLVGIARLDLPRKRDISLPFTVLVLAFASIYAVTKSGNDFVHYLNFCIIPCTLLAACGLQKVEKWALVFPVALLLWFGGNDVYHFVKEHKLNSFDSVGARDLWESPVVKEIKKRSKKDDYMVVWGWQCVYYVEAQLAQGTAENHSERSIFDLPMRARYRSRYLSDMERTKPAFVIDAVGKNSLWVQNKKTQGIESYPELYQYVRSHYTFAGDFDDTRLYIRNDRAGNL
jgi:hypothetical protein